MPSQSADIVKTHCLFIGSFACFDLVTSSSYERRSTAKITPINPPANKPHRENKKKFNPRPQFPHPQMFLKQRHCCTAAWNKLREVRCLGWWGGSRAEGGLAGLQLLNSPAAARCWMSAVLDVSRWPSDLTRDNGVNCPTPINSTACTLYPISGAAK